MTNKHEKEADTINKLKQLKLFLEDKKQVEELTLKLQSNAVLSGLNWSYTAQTIRGLQVQVTGTVD